MPLSGPAGLLLSILLTIPLRLGATEEVRSLELIGGPGHLPGVPVLIRVELRNPDGLPAREVWDGEATLRADPPGVTLVPDRVKLWNGMGSALLRMSPLDAGDVTVTASLGGLEGTLSLRSLRDEPVTVVSGVSAGPLTEWSGVVRVTGPLTVPAGATLRILPGTLVLVEGVLTGEGQPGECASLESTPLRCGTSITVRGALESLGTPQAPVTITARDPARAWGQIHHDGASPSLYRHTILTRAGNSPRSGHTATGPAIRSTGSTISLESCTLADTAGKSMQSSGSSLELHDCLLTRSIMGPEIGGTSLVMERSYLLDMQGSDDNDGIYLHGQRPGQEISLRGCVVASGDDDGIDTLGSEVTIEDSIVRDWDNPDEDSKGISVFSGEADIRRTLVVNNKVGISAKGQDTGVTVRMERVTAGGNLIGVEANDKFGKPDLEVLFFISSSIVRGPDAVRTDYPLGDMQIRYSDLSEVWAGAGNTTLDPLFVDAAAGDFRLRRESPCIDAGDPAAAPDPDGTRADMGAFFHTAASSSPRFTRGLVNEDQRVDISDPLALLFHLFAGRVLACHGAADLDDSGSLEISDAVRLLEFIFRDGAPPEPPAVACGIDPTADALPCAAPVCP